MAASVWSSSWLSLAIRVSVGGSSSTTSTYLLMLFLTSSCATFVQDSKNRDVLRNPKHGKSTLHEAALNLSVNSLPITSGSVPDFQVDPSFWKELMTKLIQRSQEFTAVETNSRNNTGSEANFVNFITEFLANVSDCQRPDFCGSLPHQEHRKCHGKHCNKKYRNRQLHSYKQLLIGVLYMDWASWSPCTRSCHQHRRRKCMVPELCFNSYIHERRRCHAPGTKCQRRFNVPSRVTLASIIQAHTSVPDLASGRLQQIVDKRLSQHRNQGVDKQNNHLKSSANSDTFENTQDTCGQRPPPKVGTYRVIGGQEARRLSWPWQVSILTHRGEQYCGGTLIAAEWVLTAAHCVRKKHQHRQLILRLGEHSLQINEGSEISIKPERKFPHPDFDYATIINDIALVRLDHKVEPSNQIGYACLPDSANFVPDSDALCFILGWGKRKNTHILGTDTLHEVQVPLVSHRQCQKVFDYDIMQTQLCAGYRHGRKDSCAGDSGGPLLCPKTVNGVTRWYLVGITSYGEGCGRPGKYGIYTKVSSYLDWIQNTMANISLIKKH